MIYLSMGVILFSSLLFMVESGTYDQEKQLYYINGEPSDFQSLPLTFYWCVTTMTTVGYGDFYPITDLGRFIACVTMVSGLIIMSLPMTVIGSNFADEMDLLKEQQEVRLMRQMNQQELQAFEKETDESVAAGKRALSKVATNGSDTGKGGTVAPAPVEDDAKVSKAVSLGSTSPSGGARFERNWSNQSDAKERAARLEKMTQLQLEVRAHKIAENLMELNEAMTEVMDEHVAVLAEMQERRKVSKRMKSYIQRVDDEMDEQQRQRAMSQPDMPVTLEEEEDS